MAFENDNGFILMLDENYRANGVDFIDRNAPFSEGMSSRDFEPKSKEIFFISTDGKNLNTICLGERKRHVLTLKYRVEFKQFVKLSPAIIVERIQPTLTDYFIHSAIGGGRKVPADLWEELLQRLVKERPELKSKIEDLIRIKNQRTYLPDAREMDVYKHDATNSSISFSGMDGRTAKMTIYKKSENEDTPEFVKWMEESRLREDRLIEYDAQVFGDWKKVDFTPSAMVRFQQGKKELLIRNFNRDIVEEQLGVDLLYYNKYYRSFVLVQYKRLEEEGKIKGYRLGDKTYEQEFQKMKNLEQVLSKASKTNAVEITNYRLNEGVCFFKLCDPVVKNVASHAMISGFYLPLQYWSLLADSPHILGVKGGKRITSDNADRYLNNTQFVDLVKAGWIGSNHAQSDLLDEIISQILASGRSLVLAELREQQQQPRTFSSRKLKR